MTELISIEAVAGFFTPTVIFVIVLVLHVIIPALRVEGYVHEETTAAPVQHRLNGLIVFICALVIWWFELTTVSIDWLWRVKWSAMAGSVALSVVLAVWLVLRAPADDRRFLLQWVEGHSRNVQFFGHVDVKMFLYIFGGTLLALNVVSSAAYHYGQFGDASNIGLFLHTAMWLWFVADYFSFERVHLYTFDIIEERVGWKLIFGCVAVYPCMYPVALWGLADAPAPEIDPSLHYIWLGGSIVIFLIGWVITRGANLQKYTFKRWPEQVFLGFIKPTVLTNGEKSILNSGLWGAARHMNYLGEILIVLAMALALGHFTNLWAWIYFIYLTIFFVARERIDDRKCAAKYGELWKEYRSKVRFRLIPKVY